MSDPYAAPAGWYPEPHGTGGQRWWDGTTWTEYSTPRVAPSVAPSVAPPVAQYAPYDGGTTQARVPEGTPVDTVWIWLIVALPVLVLIPFFMWDFEGYLIRSMNDPMAQVSMYLDPMYLTSVALGWLAPGAAVLFAYRDVVALRRMGYTRQFHWAWAFLSFFSFLVYVIGRSVVVKRQAGRGSAPMWVAIILNVAVFIGVIVWIFVAVANFMNSAISSYPSVV